MPKADALSLDRDQRIRHPLLCVRSGARWLRVSNADGFAWLVFVMAAPIAGVAQLFDTPEIGLAAWVCFTLGVYAHATRQSIVTWVIAGLVSAGLSLLVAWLAPWAGAVAFVLTWASVTVELDVQPGRARFERRVLGVPVAWRALGPAAAD